MLSRRRHSSHPVQLLGLFFGSLCIHLLPQQLLILDALLLGFLALLVLQPTTTDFLSISTTPILTQHYH